jgi:RNA polymerase sigma-70 factor (ECF subfamily)
MPHLDAAFNLARWLAGNDHDAQDIVQDAMVRAYRFFGGYRGGNSRSWLLTIVRNAAYSWIKQNRPSTVTTVGDDALLEVEDSAILPADEALLERANAEALRAALEELLPPFREAIVLRELEDMSYKEIADVAGVPIGTVMSRLARARQQLQQILTRKGKGEIQK